LLKLQCANKTNYGNVWQ